MPCPSTLPVLGCCSPGLPPNTFIKKEVYVRASVFNKGNQETMDDINRMFRLMKDCADAVDFADVPDDARFRMDMGISIPGPFFPEPVTECVDGIVQLNTGASIALWSMFYLNPYFRLELGRVLIVAITYPAYCIYETRQESPGAPQTISCDSFAGGTNIEIEVPSFFDITLVNAGSNGHAKQIFVPPGSPPSCCTFNPAP